MIAAPAAADETPAGLQEPLRQMISVLERERQALAALDRDELVNATREKEALCDVIGPMAPGSIDAETRTLAETARQLNEINRRVRNLLAANVATRLEALGGKRATYQAANIAHA
ncbi:MAG: flagellar protein FlgN [Erythrobacter sp.]